MHEHLRAGHQAVPPLFPHRLLRKWFFQDSTFRDFDRHTKFEPSLPHQKRLHPAVTGP